MSSSASAPTSSRPSWWICRRIARPWLIDRAGTPRASRADATPRPGPGRSAHAEVRLLDQQPAARRQPGHHPPEHAIRPGTCISTARVCTRSNEPAGSRRCAGHGGAPPDSAAPACPGNPSPGRRRDLPLRHRLLAHPARDRAPAAADLQAARVGSQPEPPILRIVSGSSRSANRSRRRSSSAPVCGTRNAPQPRSSHQPPVVTLTASCQPGSPCGVSVSRIGQE